MNIEQFFGACRHFAARIDECWGAICGNPARVAAARREQMAARNQQRAGLAHEQTARQLKDFQHRNRHWRF